MAATSHTAENRKRIYQTLCLTLAGQSNRMSWSAFSLADWDRLIATARAEGVAPLLYHALDEAGWPQQMPAHLRRDLQAAYYATAAQNLLLYQELSRILAALPPDLPVIVLKGAALATTLYSSIGLRPIGDLDLLVPHEGLARAVATVKALGYVPEGPEMRSGLARLTSYEANLDGGEYRPLHVELHWNLIGGEGSRYQPRIDWFWEQSEMTAFPGVQALVLKPTAHLLYLAAHLALKHGEAYAYLRWFYDIHLLVSVKNTGLDWDELILRAKEFRWAAALHAALLGTQEHFGTPLPAGFLDALADVQDRQAVRSVERKAGPVQTRAVRVWDGLEAQGWRGRLRLAWAIACPRPEYMRWRYKCRPAWLWPLYYPYRWFDIVRDGVATVWRIWKGIRDKGEREKGNKVSCPGANSR